MQFVVNENCVGCGACVSLCPEVFSLKNDGYATAVEKEVINESALDAMEECPVGAIEKK